MAREMRSAGKSFKQIAAALGVSSATTHRWTRDIELTDEQQAAIRSRDQGPEAVRRRVESWSRVCRERRLSRQEEGRARARLAEPLHIAGCMLYWCEGSKGRNSLKMVNSDRSMIVFFKRFLDECFGLDEGDYVVTLNVYLGNDLTVREIEDYWLTALELPRDCLRKHQLNHLPTSSSGKKLNKLPYGVCTLGVKRSTAITQHIFGAIQEYSGTDQPAWLDGPPRRARGSTQQ